MSERRQNTGKRSQQGLSDFPTCRAVCYIFTVAAARILKSSPFWSNDKCMCINLGLTLAELPASPFLLTVQHNSSAPFMSVVYAVSGTHSALFTVRLQQVVC